MIVELTPGDIQNICVCLIRVAKGKDTTDVEMLYLLNLVQKLKADVASANGNLLYMAPSNEAVVHSSDAEVVGDDH